MRVIYWVIFIVIISEIMFMNAANSIVNCDNCQDFEAKKPLIIEEIIRNLPRKSTITYTTVPRGIILSVAQDELFTGHSDNISEEGKILLSHVANLLEKFNNNCTIEAHSEELLADSDIYRDDWEISIVRATKIANYISHNFGIPSSRLFPIGFGKIMPFKENVAPIEFQDNRIDFVIFDYTVTR